MGGWSQSQCFSIMQTGHDFSSCPTLFKNCHTITKKLATKGWKLQFPGFSSKRNWKHFSIRLRKLNFVLACLGTLIHLFLNIVHTITHTGTLRCTHACTQTQTQTHSHTGTLAHMHAHTQTPTHTHTGTLRYTNACTHTHTHTYTQ